MTITIPVPQRNNKQLQGEFYPLQNQELVKLREVKLINNVAYVHLALRLENPFCDRPIQVIPKEFALRWKIPESSVYKAIAKLKELGILNIKSGKLVIDWVKPLSQSQEQTQKEEAIANDSNCVPNTEGSNCVAKEQNDDYQIEQKIIRSDNRLSDSAENYPIRENEKLKALVDIDSGISQTLQNFQTSQTGEEKSFSQKQESKSEQVVQDSVQATEVELNVIADQDNGSVEQSRREVVQKKTKIISPSKNSSTSIPEELVRKLEELSIPLDNKVRKAIAKHDISQAYGACRHIENTWDSISNSRSIFLYQLPKQPVEKLGSRHSEELLENVKAQNEAIEKERSDPEYFEKSKSAFAEIKATLARRKADGE